MPLPSIRARRRARSSTPRRPALTLPRVAAVALGVAVAVGGPGLLTADADDSAPPPETVSTTLSGLEAHGEAEAAITGDATTTDFVRAPLRYSAIAFHHPAGLAGAADEAGVDVWFRTSADGEQWSEWEHAAPLDGADGPDPDTAEHDADVPGTHSHLAWVGAAEWLHVTVVGGDTADVDVTLIDSMGLNASPALSWLEEATQTLRAAWSDAGPAPAAAADLRPDIVSRADWGADESLAGEPTYAGEVEHGIVHHTATSNDYSRAEAPGVVRGIYEYHTERLGWKDIGYNLLIDRYGDVYEGRAGGVERAVVGAHAAGFNATSFGVSLIGDFEAEAPPEDVVETLTQVLGWKSTVHGLDPEGTVTVEGGCDCGTSRYPPDSEVTLEVLSGHRDVGKTACPGRHVYGQLDDIRARASAAADAMPDPVRAEITSPALDEVLYETVPVHVDAGGGSGIDRVALFVREPGSNDETHIDGSHEPPWELAWDTETVEPGDYELVAVAVDNDEYRGRGVLSVSVADAEPHVRWGTPSDGAPVAGETTLEVDAGSAVSDIERVGFFVRDGGQWLPAGAAHGEPWAIDWDTGTVGDGDRELRATAEDADGRTSDASIAVTVANAPPRVTLHAPATAEADTAATVAAEIEAGAGVEEAALVVDGARVAGRTSPPWRWEWTPDRGGERDVAVEVVDRLGRSAADATTVEVAGPAFSDSGDSAHAENIDRLHDEYGVAGCGEGRYCPAEAVRRDQMASLIVSVAERLEPADGADFSDVDADNPHAPTIGGLVEAGVTSGCAEDRYCPADSITRGQLASFLVAAAADLEPDHDASPPYDDVNDDWTHTPAIAALTDAGVVSGCGDGRYCPLEPITRGQLATMLIRAVDHGL